MLEAGGQERVQGRLVAGAGADEKSFRDGKAGEAGPGREADGGFCLEGGAGAEGDDELLQGGGVGFQRVVEILRGHCVFAGAGGVRDGQGACCFQDEGFEGLRQEEEMGQDADGLGRAVDEAEMVDEGGSGQTEGPGVAMQLRREGDVRNLELADVVDVEELRQLEQRHNREALPEGYSVIIKVQSQEGGHWVGWIVVAPGWGVERKLLQRFEVFDQAQMAFELTVQIMVVNLESYRNDATAQLVMFEEGAEEVFEFFNSWIIDPFLSWLSHIDVDEFVDVWTIDLSKNFAHERGDGQAFLMRELSEDLAQYLER